MADTSSGRATQPAATIPCGLDREGLPIGLQIVGGHARDALVLRAAERYDEALKQLDAALILESTGRVSVTGEGIGERLKDVATYALLGILLQEDKHGTL